MRILFVSEWLGYFGGVEVNVAETARALGERGHDCFLAYGNGTGRDETGYEEHFKACLRCAEMADANSASDAISIDSIVERCAPDVIYLQKVKRVDLCVRHLGKIRVVRMVHDHELCCPRGWKGYAIGGRVCRHKTGWRCWLDGAFIGRDRGSALGVKWVRISDTLREIRANHALDSFLVGSRFMQEELTQNGFPIDRIQIVPPMVRYESLESPSPTPSNGHILYVGQLVRGKGVDMLLEALSLLRCTFSATIVGEGNAKEKLKRKCTALDLDDQVKFEGWIASEKLGPYYESAQVVAVPSRGPEAFGMVGLEAMHHGRAVVAFKAGGIEDWLVDGETGFLIPEQDVVSFADALERLVLDIELATTMGTQARQRAVTEYAFGDYVAMVEKALAG